MPEYLTEWARNGARHTVATRSLGESIESASDILTWAASKPAAAVTMVCGSLNFGFRENVWKSIVGRTFEDHVSDVIESGGTIRILLANSPAKDGPFSTHLVEMLRRNGSQLEVRATGKPKFWEGFPHFMIAEFDSERWARVEMPNKVHPPLSANAKPEQRIDGVLLDREETSEGLKSALLESFSELFADVAQRDKIYYAIGV